MNRRPRMVGSKKEEIACVLLSAFVAQDLCMIVHEEIRHVSAWTGSTQSRQLGGACSTREVTPGGGAKPIGKDRFRGVGGGR